MSEYKVMINRGSVFAPEGIKGEVVDPIVDMPGIRGWLARGFALSLLVRITDEKSSIKGKVTRVGLGRIAFGKQEVTEV